MSTDLVVQQAPVCTDPTGNCSECCSIFTNADRRALFGYQADTATCTCHDICVEDVRDICAMNRTVRHIIPCTAAGSAGCRGGFLPDGPLAVQSWRVLCAEECLNPPGCDRINNEVEFEVVLRAGSTNIVITPRDDFSCMWFDFARFPSGVRFTNNTAGLNAFRNEMSLIDGSCKVIIIRSVTTETVGNDCFVVINYTIIDKLWKHENLLVSAIAPYIGPGEVNNITVKQEFGQGHNIGPCTGGSCGVA